MPASTSRPCIRPARHPRPTTGHSTPSSRRRRPATRRAFRSASGSARRPISVDTCGAIFQSFDAELVNAKGDITVKSDNVKKALEYWKQLVPYLPPDAPAWDDASNNKVFVAGKTALIMNPPSAWAVARRDRPEVAEQTWHHGMAAGPAGRYGPFTTPFWGIWNFSKNQSAAKSLLTALSQADAIETMVKASAGFDIPAFANLTTLKVWAGGRAAQGHALSLLQPVQTPDPVDRRRTRAAQDRRSDLSAGASAPDGGALRHQGRADGQGAGLRGQRARRLHANLSQACGARERRSRARRGDRD